MAIENLGLAQVCENRSQQWHTALEDSIMKTEQKNFPGMLKKKRFGICRKDVFLAPAPEARLGSMIFIKLLGRRYNTSCSGMYWQEFQNNADPNSHLEVHIF